MIAARMYPYEGQEPFYAAVQYLPTLPNRVTILMQVMCGNLRQYRNQMNAPRTTVYVCELGFAMYT